MKIIQWLCDWLSRHEMTPELKSALESIDFENKSLLHAIEQNAKSIIKSDQNPFRNQKDFTDRLYAHYQVAVLIKLTDIVESSTDDFLKR